MYIVIIGLGMISGLIVSTAGIIYKLRSQKNASETTESIKKVMDIF